VIATLKAMRSFIATVCFSFLLFTFASAAETNVWRQAGVPSPDREWMSFDYTLAAKVFLSNKVPLPRLSDPEGKRLLDTIVSTNNLAFYCNKSLPLQIRLSGWIALLKGANDILKQYLAEAGKGRNVDSEMTQIEAFLLYTSVVGFKLVDEYLPQIPKDDKYETRMEGLAKMNSGAVTTFAGASTVLTAPETYNAHDRQVILSAMAETLPTFKKAFPPSYVEELKQKLSAVRPKISEPENVRRIDSMLATLAN
jgi:hypothetical protein